MADTLIGFIHDHLLKEAKGPTRDSKGVFHPSALPGCARAVYYDFIGSPAESMDTPHSLLRMRHGTAIHTLLQDMFQDAFGKRFQREVGVKTGHPIIGHCDGVVTLKDGTKFGIEIKSAKRANFLKYKKVPNYAHVQQATAYAACLSLPFMHIIYYEKDDQTNDPLQLADHRIKFDPMVWAMLVKKMEMIKDCAKTGNAPEREVSFMCKTCKFLKFCRPPGVEIPVSAEEERGG